MNQTSLWQNRNFQLHWWSSATSQICGFFSLVALPWLVLSLTNNNPFIMSSVLAASSFPQTIFMVFGGVLADRFSPFKMLFMSRILFAVLMGSLAIIVYLNFISLWMIYLYSFAFGILIALMIPGGQALLPSLLGKHHLAKANGLIMATTQIAQIVGAILAGWTIWYLKKIHGVAENQADNFAFSCAFAIDCLGASIAIVLMYFIRLERFFREEANFLTMFKQGVSFCWKDKGIRLVLAYVMLISFFVQGVLISGLPIFTKLHLGLAELAYGNLHAMMGIGVMFGVGIGVLLKPTSGQMGVLILVCDFVSGIGFFLLGMASHFIYACLCLLAVGICAGIVMLTGTTWFQSRTPDFLMGRVLGILMFAVVGLIPVSSFFAGFLMLHFPVSVVISGAGCTIILFAFVGMVVPSIRRMGYIKPINFDFVSGSTHPVAL